MSQPHKTSAIDFIDHGSDTYTFLKDPVTDALMQVVIELGAETWITRRRMLVLERVMDAQGLLAPEMIETYTPTPEDEAHWRQERDRMLKSVYAALGRVSAGAEDAAERAKSPEPPRRPPLNSTEAAARAQARGASGV